VQGCTPSLICPGYGQLAGCCDLSNERTGLVEQPQAYVSVVRRRTESRLWKSVTENTVVSPFKNWSFYNALDSNNCLRCL